MSEDLSDTTTDSESNSNEQDSTQNKDGKIVNTDEMDIETNEANVTTPPLRAKHRKFNKGKEKDWNVGNNTTKPKSCKPRLTVKEYMSSQKVYDVLKDPEDALPIGNSLSLKTVNMTSKNKRALIPFPPFINVTIKEQRAINSTGTFADKPTITVKISTDDSIPAPSTTVLVDETTTMTTITSPTINSSTTLVSPINSIVLNKSAKKCSESSKLITAEAVTKSSTSNNTSPASKEISTTILNENSSSVNTTKSIAKNGNNTAELSTSNKSPNLKWHKMPIHPLSKSRNCVLLSTTTSNTDTSKGIIKFIPRKYCPAKNVSDKCNDSNTSDSNGNETFSRKESEKVSTAESPTVDKELLVITTDVNIKKTAVNIPIVPLVGKRKYTDPATMPPILSFSYQKSLSDYIRKAKDFHKRAKLCSTIIDNLYSNEKERVENMVSTDIDMVNTQDGSGNNDNTNKECNVAQGKGNNNQQKLIRAMDVDEEANNETETIEEIDILRDVGSTTDARNIENIETNEGIDSLKDVEPAEDTKTLAHIESVESTDNLKNVESTENTKNLKNIASAVITENLKNVEPTEDTKALTDVELTGATKNAEDIESSEGTDKQTDGESVENTKILKGVELVESTDILKGIKSAEFTKSIEDIESSEDTDSQSEVELVDDIKDEKGIEKGKLEIANNLKNVEPNEDTNNLKYMEATECTENLNDLKSSEGAYIRKNVTTTTDMGTQIDIESDLFTYEIFNNVSGISNTSTRNEHTQTKDSTIKILKNIFELKEKVQQQAEEIMSLKAAMKLLNTPNILNKR